MFYHNASSVHSLSRPMGGALTTVVCLSRLCVAPLTTGQDKTLTVSFATMLFTWNTAKKKKRRTDTWLLAKECDNVFLCCPNASVLCNPMYWQTFPNFFLLIDFLDLYFFDSPIHFCAKPSQLLQVVVEISWTGIELVSLWSPTRSPQPYLCTKEILSKLILVFNYGITSNMFKDRKSVV